MGFVLTNQDVAFGPHKLANSINAMALDLSADAQESTTFGSGGWREYEGGLKALGFSMSGFYGADPVDAYLEDRVSLANTIIQVCPQNATAGAATYFFKGVQTQYSRNSNVGDMAAFSVTAQNNAPQGAVRGTLMLNSATLNATANGVGRLLGAVLANQKLYAALNVFGVAGTAAPTLAMKVQSDDNAGFTSPTDRLTFTNVTAVGAQWQETAGPITDTYWRLVYTITGTNPVFGAMVSLGIK